MPSVPNFRDLLWPMVEALRKLGGSGTNAEIDDAVIDHMKLSEAQLSVLHNEGPKSQVEYLLAWARTFLKKAGMATNSARGVWALTEKGRLAKKAEVEAVREEVNRRYRTRGTETRQRGAGVIEDADAEDVEEVDEAWRSTLLQAMLEMPPAGFERLAQRLLREAGVESLEVTGKPGDGGIDGSGKLYSSLFSVKVYFQCKRWRNTVGPAEVRDFRGAMEGRGERGLLITTGTFTREAEREAERAGAKPIELIGGDRLCDLLKRHQVGLAVESVERVTVDLDFFKSV